MSQADHIMHRGARRVHRDGQMTAPRHLMCPACWALVSEQAKAEVWAHYRPGQERDKKPSRLWLAAAMEAKADVMDARGLDGSGYRAMAAKTKETKETA